MGTLTETYPKCLLSLQGKTLLEWQMEALKKAGISQIGMVTGYLKERLEKFPLTFFENSSWHKSNMVRSLLEASKWLEKENCIVAYADIVYPTETVERLKNTEGNIVVSYNTQWEELWKERFSDPLSDLETFTLNARGNITSIGKKPKNKEEIQGQYMGLLKFTQRGWETISKYLSQIDEAIIDRLSMTELLQDLISNGVTIESVPIHGKWYEIDSEKDFRLCESWASSGRSWLK